MFLVQASYRPSTGLVQAPGKKPAPVRLFSPWRFKVSTALGGTPFQNTFSLHFLHDGLKDLQITNHSSSSYSILYSLLPSSHFSGSDWLCSETKCKDVPLPAPEEGSVRRRGDLLKQCHPRVEDGSGCEL